MYTLTFEIDPAHTINQARRSGQSLTYLRWQPNLVMTAIKSDYPAVFYWERPVTTTITTSIHNLGYVTSTATSLQLSASVPGRETYPGETLVVPPLSPDASVDITGSQVMPSLGEHTITATLQLVWPDGGIYSSSTVLNLLATAPDLTITSLTSDDRVVHYQGDPITQTITATIRNSGMVASFPGKVEFSASILSGGTVYTGQVEIVPSLAPGASVPVTATLVISSPGLHVVTATAQYDHVELDSQNNTATLSILAAIPPALFATHTSHQSVSSKSLTCSHLSHKHPLRRADHDHLIVDCVPLNPQPASRKRHCHIALRTARDCCGDRRSTRAGATC